METVLNDSLADADAQCAADDRAVDGNREIIIVSEFKIQIGGADSGVDTVRRIFGSAGTMRTAPENRDAVMQLKQRVIQRCGNLTGRSKSTRLNSSHTS